MVSYLFIFHYLYLSYIALEAVPLLDVWTGCNLLKLFWQRSAASKLSQSIVKTYKYCLVSFYSPVLILSLFSLMNIFIYVSRLYLISFIIHEMFGFNLPKRPSSESKILYWKASSI